MTADLHATINAPGDPMRNYLEQRERVLETRIAGLEALLCDAQAAIAAEREACAKIADEGAYYGTAEGAEDMARTLAKLIRARA